MSLQDGDPSVLHLSYSKGGGGAADAAFRLHESLSSIGFKSSYRYLGSRIDEKGNLIRRPVSRAFEILGLARHYTSRLLIQAQRTPNKHWHSLSCFPSWFDKELNSSEQEIVHLHWLQSEFISIEAIGRIRKKVVWTLHDCWPLTGAEHHPCDHHDNRFEIGYFRNNRLDGSCGLDLDRWCWERKMRSWCPSRFTLIAPSTWSRSQALRSRLWRDCDIHVIPNIVDKVFFSDKSVPSETRNRLGLNGSEVVIVLGAAYAARDKNKGLDIVGRILQDCIWPRCNARLVLFGLSSSAQKQFLSRHGELSDRIILLPFLSQERLAELFSITDIVVVPSRLESFGLIAAEAQASGVPVISYRTSGLSDIVADNNTGFLVDSYDEGKLVSALNKMVDNSRLRRILGHRAKTRARSRFSADSIVRKHILLYRSLL